MSGLPRSNPGERVGAFVIDRYLASGGMGDVYEAHHAETGAPAALKLLAKDTDAALQRFQREGRIAARLDHPNIVRTFGFGTTPDARCWLAMELLEGEDLDARIRGPGVSPTDAVDLAMQVCAALDSAHRAGIVHRDLKPQNIFLCRREGGGFTAKVLDFGIAHLLEGGRGSHTSMLEQRVTKTGVIIGTLSYVSPEQARGERDLDHRSDLWSLGVVLYQCLTGSLPFEAPSGPGTLYKILFETPRDVAKVRPGLPEPLADVVRRCLSKARDGRPTGAAAMRAALAAVDLPTLSAAFRASRPPPSAPIDTDAVTQLPDMGTGIGATVMAPSTATDLEVRLTSVVYLNRVRDHNLVQRAANELLGRVITLAGDDVLVVFGMDRWNGDEPQRAVRLALATNAICDRIGVATGRALQGGEGVAGAAVDDAVRLSRQREKGIVGSSRVDLQACKLEYSIVSPK